ncbi:hypothetical protein NDU88_007709 [Pleurodeles waltl]|uniref:Uncharacterized protein n=1 Tax=Pleurodeles waltl TaxID=8319 RepID=A0AAV7ST32_PLEWA|nr:hypothetical protein NDU88_007709 [Pleurodeles waltl]
MTAETAPAPDADITSGLFACVQPALKVNYPRLNSYLHLQTLKEPPTPGGGESLEMSAQVSAQETSFECTK